VDEEDFRQAGVTMLGKTTEKQYVTLDDIAGDRQLWREFQVASVLRISWR